MRHITARARMWRRRSGVESETRHRWHTRTGIHDPEVDRKYPLVMGVGGGSVLGAFGAVVDVLRSGDHGGDSEVTNWRVAWNAADGTEVLMDVPGGELGKHGAREQALQVEGYSRTNIRVMKSEDGKKWEVA